MEQLILIPTLSENETKDITVIFLIFLDISRN